MKLDFLFFYIICTFVFALELQIRARSRVAPLYRVLSTYLHLTYGALDSARVAPIKTGNFWTVFVFDCNQCCLTFLFKLATI